MKGKKELHFLAQPIYGPMDALIHTGLLAVVVLGSIRPHWTVTVGLGALVVQNHYYWRRAMWRMRR